MTSLPDLSICIATLNASNYLRDCLRFIREQPNQLHWVDSDPSLLEPVEHSSTNPRPGLMIEVIIVDSASTEDTLSMLAREFPAVCLIRNDRNEGFSRPVNQALRVSRGRYMLALNPDTIVHPGALNELV